MISQANKDFFSAKAIREAKKIYGFFDADAVLTQEREKRLEQRRQRDVRNSSEFIKERNAIIRKSNLERERIQRSVTKRTSEEDAETLFALMNELEESAMHDVNALCELFEIDHEFAKVKARNSVDFRMLQWRTMLAITSVFA